MNEIEYLLFKRSALQFKADLTELFKCLEYLSEEQMMVVSAYLRYIKRLAENVDDKISNKVL